MTGFTLPGTPGELSWNHRPLDWQVGPGNSLTITAGENTNWFIDPAGARREDSAPAALFTPPDTSFLLSARVRVDFASTFDAGALQLRSREDLWAKLCFEYSPQGESMIVSVVTRGVSDDCNSVVVESREVYLRIAHTPRTTAFHYSRDGRYWHLVRYFTLGEIPSLRVGLSCQSPRGRSCRAVFSEIRYLARTLEDNRSGE
jgi:regulation of enolase protein 1 (concanavalin A-like superfamily)